ncbi:MAG: hypothetical protein OXR73_31770 [Myxococcales bacterium]|nr:hypothetical protein [Myxococcales bacterium]
MGPRLRICLGALLVMCFACDATPKEDSPPQDRSPERDRRESEEKEQSSKSESDEAPSKSEDSSDRESERASAGDSARPSESEDGPSESAGVQIHMVANDPMIQGPMDATPGPDGEVVYFTATAATDDADGLPTTLPGVYRTGANGGEIVRMCEGAPLVSPTGIAVSLDGETLFLADPGIANGGALLRGPAGETTDCPEPLAATVGMAPRGVVVAEVDGEEVVFFTGQVPESGSPGLFRLDGDVAEEVASGAPFAAPAGVVVASDGAAYVIDALASNGVAALLRVDAQGEVDTVVGGLGVGFPAGITLEMSESSALVSGLSPETGRDVVYVVDLDSAEVSTVTDTVDAFAEPAGLHRAHNRNVFAWADSEANDTGTVYVLEL